MPHSHPAHHLITSRNYLRLGTLQIDCPDVWTTRQIEAPLLIEEIEIAGTLKGAAFDVEWGIDATAPLTRESWLYERAVPPGVDRVDYV